MKKIYLLLLVGVFFVSCDKGAVHGTVSYSVAKHAIPKVDYYAEIYLTQLNVDTIVRYLQIIETQEDIEKATEYLDYVYKQNEKDSLANLIIQKQQSLVKLMPKSFDFEKLEKQAFSSYQRIKYDVKNTIRLSADENGSFSAELKTGLYNVIIKSEGAKRNNVLERRGQIYITKTEVVKNKQNLINAVFIP